MRIKLPKEVLGSLPAPDRQGLVRVSATLEIIGEGEVNLMEINDSPVPSSNEDAPVEEPEIPADLAGGAPPQY